MAWGLRVRSQLQLIPCQTLVVNLYADRSGGLYFNVFQHDSVWLLMVRIFIHYNYEVTSEAITVI